MPSKFYRGDGNRFVVRWKDVDEGINARIAQAKLEATSKTLDECLDALADAVREKFGDYDPDWDLIPRRPLPEDLRDNTRYITLDSRGVAHYAHAAAEYIGPQYCCLYCSASTLRRSRNDTPLVVERIEAPAAMILEDGGQMASRKLLEACPDHAFKNFEFQKVGGKTRSYVEIIPRKIRMRRMAKKWFSGFKQHCTRCGSAYEEAKNQPLVIGGWLLDEPDLGIFEAIETIGGNWDLVCQTDFYESNRPLLRGLSDYFESEIIAAPESDLIEPRGFQLHPEDIRDPAEFEPWSPCSEVP